MIGFESKKSWQDYLKKLVQWPTEYCWNIKCQPLSIIFYSVLREELKINSFIN